MGNPADVTVRRVANHSWGCLCTTSFSMKTSRTAYRRETKPSFAMAIRLEPGEKYQYSNLGYGILDYVITRVSGKDYDEFMRTEVFLPLGMTYSSIGIGPGLEKQQAIRYGTDGLPIPFYDFDHPGASAVYASAHDLVTYGMFHLKSHLPNQKAILGDESIDEMQTTMPAEENWMYGIGWRSGKHSSGHRVVFHTGGMGGVSTLLCMLPDDKVVFVVLVNASTPLTGIVRDEMIVFVPQCPVCARGAGPAGAGNCFPTSRAAGGHLERDSPHQKRRSASDAGDQGGR